jgi:class 3 adenylate cyclase
MGRGDAMTGAAPSGVVTFLFTDVEGSTLRWENDANDMRAALAAHDEVLRSAIETHGGLLFKHTGDGVCAAFSSPKAGVDAAVAAQRALELPVRMGLATGEAELREGDYFGAVLNRAARVMAAGHGGQILLAESTAGLLTGVDLVDLGPRRLRDLPTPIGVFQLRAAGLRTEFPALRALDVSPAYDWFTIELANLRAAFRCAADQGDLDVAAPIATYAAWVGYLNENYEPIAWAEELIEPARAIDHPRLTALYAVASNCYMAGRIDPAIRYTEAAQRAISGGSGHVPYGAEGYVGGAYVAVGQPQRWIRWCRAQLARGLDTDTVTRACLLIGLMATGSHDEAMAAADGLIDAAEATGNPYVLSFALHAYGWAIHDADPVRSLVALRRGLVIAQDSGNRLNQSNLATNLCLYEAEHGDPLAAFDYFTVAIGNSHDSGNTYMIRAPLGLLAAFFDRLGRYEPAATIAGFFVTSPLAALPVMAEFGTAIAHLRDVLGDATYESLARKGETMTTAEMVAYAYDQIDQARAELNAVAK